MLVQVSVPGADKSSNQMSDEEWMNRHSCCGPHDARVLRAFWPTDALVLVQECDYWKTEKIIVGVPSGSGWKEVNRCVLIRWGEEMVRKKMLKRRITL